MIRDLLGYRRITYRLPLVTNPTQILLLPVTIGYQEIKIFLVTG